MKKDFNQNTINMKKTLLLFALVFGLGLHLFGQVNTTANDVNTPYTGYFRPGINLGYYPPFNDKDLGNLAAGNPEVGVVGIGAKTTRPALPDEFLEQWGYDVRVDEFAHYTSLGLEDLTCIVGYPSAAHRDNKTYNCVGGGSTPSNMFANLYTPIWDGGANGTPYNDNNYYAAYIYKLVSKYGQHIKYWEVWNEPAYTSQWQKGYYPKSDHVAGNWWENDPTPCDLERFHGTIQEYIRMMRITYQIVKSIDPDDYVLIGGVAFPAFLDAVLRNTDNPNGGAVTPEYPLGGGAYFDVMGIHVYPDIDGTVKLGYNNQTQQLDYLRNSDRGAYSIERRKTAYEEVLFNYGYNGATYPQKQWIITEMNAPRRKFGANSMASQETQINFLIKAMTKAEKFGFHQVETYALVDKEKEGAAIDEFDLLGLYKNFKDESQGAVADYANVVMNPEGQAYKTYSDLTFRKRYDAARVAAMNLPNSIDGAAFKGADGKYQYVLWAKTTQDLSEYASATYSFPASFNIGQLKRQEWNASFTGNSQLVGPNNLQLTGRPIYLSEDLSVNSNLTPFFTAATTTGCGAVTTKFTNFSLGNPTTFAWTFEGGTPATSSEQSPTVTFSTAGFHAVSLTIGNGTDTETLTKDNYIKVDANPNPQFSYAANGLQVTFTNTSTSAISYRWYFGDGGESSSVSPIHTFNTAGIYEVRLEATNDCGTISTTQTLTLTSDAAMPVSSFSADAQSGCAPMTVHFVDNSTNNPVGRSWSFPGGTPSSSSEANPTVVYNNAGSFSVSLSVSNAAGADFSTQSNFITVMAKPNVSYSYQLNGNSVAFAGNSSDGTVSWNFGDGETSTELNPIHTYSTAGSYTVSFSSQNDCGVDTETKTIIIAGGNAETPVADFTMDNASGCAPLTVNFTNTSTNEPTSYAWTFVGGTPATSTSANPTVVFTSVGQHAVILVASNSAGSTTKVKSIEVKTTPTANFTYSSNGKEVTFISNTNGTVVGWNFGDGMTSTDNNPVHTYATDGTYAVVLTVENSCGQETVSNTLLISTTSTGDGPVADFKIGDANGCAPFVVEYKDLSTNNPTSWSWAFPGGTPSTSTSQNPIVVYSQPGNYSATLTASNASGFNTITKGDLITVGAAPVADFNVAIFGSQLTLINTSVRADTYVWDFGDGESSTDASPTHNYSQSGTYIVTLTTKNDCGETSKQSSVMIVIDVIPDTKFTVDKQQGCLPFTVNFTDISTMEPDHWVWSFPGGTPSTSTDRNPTVTYNTTGVFDVSLTATNSAGSKTTTQSAFIDIFDKPTASFYTIKEGPSVQLINTSEGRGTYLWDFGDDQTSVEESLTHQYKYAGEYTIMLTAANICGSDTYETTINIVTANDDLEALNLFELTPNPTADIVNLKVQGRAERTLNITVYNILGTSLVSKNIDFSTGVVNEPIDLSKFANGTYIVKVQTDNQIGLQKIILQK